MKARLLLGTTLVALIIGLAVLDHFLESRICLSTVIALLGFTGWCELAHMSGAASRERGGSKLLFLCGSLSTLGFLALGWIDGRSQSQASEQHILTGIMLLLFCSFATLVFRRDFETGFQPLLMTIVGVLLFGFLFSYLLRIYHRPDGLRQAVVFFFGIKGNDMAAYLVGRAFGRIRFLAVSPKKSLEGCLAAMIFSVVWFTAVGWMWPEPFFHWWWGIPVGIILSVTTQVGDLSESLIKRFYRVKDSSSLLPEFGGVLDLVDSVLFSGYIFWILGAL